MNVYDFTVKDNKNVDVSLKQYEGKLLLVVNTATECGLTPQYEHLQSLYKQFADQGFVVLDFPCNQFKNQAPGTNEEIESFCQVTFNTTFPRFAKIDVNGKNAVPLFVWLKEQMPQDKTDENTATFVERVKEFVKYENDSDIKWNFGKFLVNREGQVVARYSPNISPEKLIEDIKSYI